MDISNIAKNISPSLTLAISAEAKRLASSGVSMINFGVGEPDFATPEYIIEATKHALDKGMTKYTPAAGIPKLREAVANYHSEETGFEIKAENVVITDGGKSALFHAMAAILNAGDEVILPSPYWLTYPEQIRILGGVVVEVFCEDGKITPEQLANACTAKTKLFIMNSPSNPTGAVYSQEELEKLARVCEEKGIYIISDEIYAMLVYDGAKHYSISAVNEYTKTHTIIVSGVSKSYAMTGYRIGWVVAPKEIAAAVNSLQSHITSAPASFAQDAAAAAIIGGRVAARMMHDMFAQRRTTLLKLLEKLQGISYVEPQGAFYVFMNVSAFYGKCVDGVKIDGSVAFCKKALDEGIALVPGVAFGDDRCVRISYAVNEDDIALGIQRFDSYLKKFQ